MALETNTLVNGEWTTQTLDVNSVLQHYDQQDKDVPAKFSDVDLPPVYGLLTQTVIRSPQAHWILPVKLRNPDANDVAFIGVSESFQVLSVLISAAVAMHYAPSGLPVMSTLSICYCMSSGINPISHQLFR